VSRLLAPPHFLPFPVGLRLLVILMFTCIWCAVILWLVIFITTFDYNRDEYNNNVRYYSYYITVLYLKVVYVMAIYHGYILRCSVSSCCIIRCFILRCCILCCCITRCCILQCCILQCCIL